jgi:predicted glycoside hydrolase/deacetylase ChbG (UPF0249 family)
MRSLIVNADDVGLSDGVNEAVRRSYLSGAITGVSVMACGRCFREAAAMLRDLEKPETGVHLTLTGGFFPCTKTASKIKSLLNKRGAFPGDYWAFMARYFRKKTRMDEIYLELVNQIKKVKEEGLTITHLDSHEHVHIFPGVLKVVVSLAKEFNIPYIRLPLERTVVTRIGFRVIDLLRHEGLKAFASRAGKTITAANLKHNDTFLGHFHSGRIDDDVLVFMMKNLAEGVSELALHPGVTSRGVLSDPVHHHSNAPIELDALLNGKWRQLSESEGIRLISHKEACVC